VADYSIVFTRSARKELESLDMRVALRVLRRIESLAQNPRPSGVVKIQGTDDLWRIRVGNWRVIYRVADGENLVDVIAVRHRSDAYR
jgi:mRNA interferase RelE/StbE